MLWVEDVIKIQLEVMSGAPHTVLGAEAERLYAELEVWVAEMRKKGIGIEIPYEFAADDPVRPAPKA